jgi:protein TonB
LQVASAAKASVAASPSAKTALQPIVREAPEFPREAIAEGVASGTVKARVTLDGSGKVTGIEILDAQPRRVFDRAVRAALWRWQYEPGAPNRTADVEVAFARQ